MTVPAQAGICSTVSGALALISVMAARHGKSLRGTASAWLLSVADRLGFIRAPASDGMDEARTPDLLAFTDETALNALLCFGVFLGLTSLLLALWASARREDSLYLGAGLVSGGLALVAVHDLVGMGLLLLCTALLFAIRKPG